MQDKFMVFPMINFEAVEIFRDVSPWEQTQSLRVSMNKFLKNMYHPGGLRNDKFSPL